MKLSLSSITRPCVAGSLLGGLMLLALGQGDVAKNSLAANVSHLPTVSSGVAAAGPTGVAAAGPARVPVMPKAAAVVLYDQYNNFETYSVTSQDFEAANDAYDNQAADDFVVPAGNTWQVSAVDVLGEYGNGPGPAASFNVYFYQNGAGNLPGTLVYSALGQSYTGSSDFVITLSTPATLTPGTYWVSVQAREDFDPAGQWYWRNRTVQANNPSAWRNPGGGLGTGCAGWNVKTVCIPSQTSPEQVFRLRGPSGGYFTVTTTDEHSDGTCDTADCSLWDAANAADAHPGSTINFKPGLSGTITTKLQASGITLTAPVTIQGPGARVLTISGANAGRVFNITSGVNATISGLTIANGSSSSGGGIYNGGGTLTINNSAIASNAATNGGGIFNNFGTLTIKNSTISANTVSSSILSGSGGGIFNSGGTLHITNSTITGNTANSGNHDDSGGGIITNVGTVTITSSTIAGNAADFGGGVRNINGGTITTMNTIIALNTSANGPDVNGAFTSQGFNLIGNSTGSSGFINGVNHNQVDVASADIKLDILKNNGGPTNTMALLSGSKAIDAGSCGSGADALKTDQRGRKRPFDVPTVANVADSCDIGAFEFGPASKVKPDALLRTAAESTFTGNNIYNTEGTNQTKSTTVQPGSTATYLLKVQNDGNVLDTIKVLGTAGGSGWKVQYFDAATSQNVTAYVIASSGWWIPDLAVGGSRILRLKVTPVATIAGGSIKNVLVTASSLTDATKKDVVKATTTVASSAAPG